MWTHISINNYILLAIMLWGRGSLTILIDSSVNLIVFVSVNALERFHFKSSASENCIVAIKSNVLL